MGSTGGVTAYERAARRVGTPEPTAAVAKLLCGAAIPEIGLIRISDDGVLAAAGEFIFREYRSVGRASALVEIRTSQYTTFIALTLPTAINDFLSASLWGCTLHALLRSWDFFCHRHSYDFFLSPRRPCKREDTITRRVATLRMSCKQANASGIQTEASVRLNLKQQNLCNVLYVVQREQRTGHDGE